MGLFECYAVAPFVVAFHDTIRLQRAAMARFMRSPNPPRATGNRAMRYEFIVLFLS